MVLRILAMIAGATALVHAASADPGRANATPAPACAALGASVTVAQAQLDAADGDADAALARAEDALRSGDFASAMAGFRALAADTAREPVDRARALGGLGLAEAAQGRLSEARARFRQSAELAERVGAARVKARSMLNLALLSVESADVVSDAEAVRGPSRALVRAAGQRAAGGHAPSPEAGGFLDAAYAFARDAARAAEQGGDRVFAGRAMAAASEFAGARGRSAEADAALAAALAHVRAAEAEADADADSGERGRAALYIADRALAAAGGGGDRARAAAAEVLAIAARDAERRGDERLLSYAVGYRARVRALEGDLEGALAETLRALVLADRSGASEALFVWRGQRAALSYRLGDRAGALASYRAAAASIEQIRPLLATQGRLLGEPSSRDAVEPTLLDYVEVLLRTGGRQDLQTALDVMEQLKAIQLERYFEDTCVTAAAGDPADLTDAPANLAVVYPIVLHDRVETLVIVGGEVVRAAPARVTRADLNALVARVRALLRDPDSDYAEFLRLARRLHAVVFAPAERVLSARPSGDVDTVVFAPDGALRSIPLAALHDGERFVVERYAVATVIGLTLADPSPLNRRRPKALLAAASEAGYDAQTGLEFDALPFVLEEVDAISALAPLRGRRVRTLTDAGFTRRAFKTALSGRDYDIVHLATHGQFGGAADASFLLAHDGERVSLADLSALSQGARVRGEAIDLLTLSACQTAVGDGDAVLGIAGAAYQAGARSVVASLWSIPDRPTSQLMQRFYAQLLIGGETKARALRDAQRALIANTDTRHPFYWGAFLVIGNWL